MKDHRKAEVINEITALAKRYAGTQQLRSHMHRAVMALLKEQERTMSEGMYRATDEDDPKLTIGDYTICRQDKDSVWIQHKDGEGGQFSNELIEEVIRSVWREHF